MWPRAEQHAREETWRALVAAHKRPGFPGGKEEPWRADRTGCNPPEPQRLRRLSSSILRTGEIWADLSKPHEDRLTAASGCRPGHPPISGLIADEADDHPCLTAPCQPMGKRTVEEAGGAITNVRRGKFVVESLCLSDNTCPRCRFGSQSAGVQREFMTGAQASPVDGTIATPELPPNDVIASLLAAADVLGTG